MLPPHIHAAKIVKPVSFSLVYINLQLNYAFINVKEPTKTCNLDGIHIFCSLNATFKHCITLMKNSEILLC